MILIRSSLADVLYCHNQAIERAQLIQDNAPLSLQNPNCSPCGISAWLHLVSWLQYFAFKTTFQVSYLEKERNIAPWRQGSQFLLNIWDLLKPRQNDTDVEERSMVGGQFKDWVLNLVMPYFYETGGFEFVGQPIEEEKHLKELMVSMVCKSGNLNHKPCREYAAKKIKNWFAGKEKIDSYLFWVFFSAGSQRPTGPTKERMLSLPSLEEPFDFVKSLCDRILTGTEDEVDAEEGLMVLENCWDQLSRSPMRELLLGKVVSQVVLHKDVERLRRWRRSREGRGGTVGRALKESWAEGIFKQVDLRDQAKEKCRNMLFETIKQIFV